MTAIIKPGAGIIFMKVGTHAQETLENIIDRKRNEISQAGFALWGYGGNTCHPNSMVQPFAKSYEKKGRAIYLVMQEMDSRHFAPPVRADQSSPDGITWTDIPPKVSVLGSRFALVIKELEKQEFELPLKQTRVAVGNSQGRSGDLYISGRVDKACLEVMDEAEVTASDAKSIHIGLVAKLAEPYAVFLRNRPKNED
jgi:hypothetical protein